MKRGNALLAIFLGGLISATASACSDHDQVRASVILCESAVQHIKKCCGSAPPQISCEYAYNVPFLYCDPDCKPTEKLPDFSEEASRCIVDKDCVSITAIGACSPQSDAVKAADKITTARGCGL